MEQAVPVKGRMKWYLLAAVALAALAGTVALSFMMSRAKVEGDTPAERIKCIGRLADEQAYGAADAIASAAVGEADPAVRQAALVAMTRFVGPKHRPAVERAARDSAPPVRAEAAVLLARYGDDAAADRLNELATADPADPVRLAAITALGRAGAGRAMVHLVEIMDRSDNANARARALEAMCRRFHDPRKFDPGDTSNWPTEVERIKSSPEVQAAFAAASRPLHRRPELLTTMPHGPGAGNPGPGK